jgi:diguanylate cyclase (GGDEF)-like protein
VDAAAPSSGPRTLLRDWARDPGGIITYLLGLNTIVFVLWVLVHAGPPSFRAAVSDLVFIPTGVASVGLAWRAAKHPLLSPATRRAWILLGVAFAATLIGDALWAYYEVGLNASPFPSLADAGYLLFYPLVLAGLSAFPAAPQSRQERTTFWLDAATVLLGGWMVVWYIVLGPTAVGSEAPALEKVLSAAYPIGDLVLIFGIAAVMLQRPEEGSRGALATLAAALGLFLVADLSFGYLSFLDAYESGDWPDALWMIAQFGFAVSAQYQHWSGSRGDAAAHTPPVDPHRVSSLPYGAIGLGYVLLIVAARSASIYPLGGMLFGAVAITAVVVTRQLLLLRELRAIAVTDGLTGLPTRQHFTQLAGREFARAVRYGRPLSAMLIDVDGFKSINDRFGHPVGDEVLRLVARRMRETFRETDILGRYGGDEFVVMLPESAERAAQAAAERLVRAVAGSTVLARGEGVPVTVSAGVAAAEGCPDVTTLLRHADDALYRAKRAGRDQVSAFSPNPA